MDDMERVLSWIKTGVEIGSIQDAMKLEDTTMYHILVELVRLGKVKVTVAW